MMNPCIEIINGIQMNKLGFREKVMRNLIEKEMKGLENGEEEFKAFLKAQEGNAFKFSLDSEKITESLKALKEKNEKQKDEVDLKKLKANEEEFKKYKKEVEERVNELLFEFDVRSDVINHIKTNTDESMKLLLKQIDQPPRKKRAESEEMTIEPEKMQELSPKAQRERLEMEIGLVNPLKWLTMNSGIGDVSERTSFSQRKKVNFSRSPSPGKIKDNPSVEKSLSKKNESHENSFSSNPSDLDEQMSNSSSVSWSSSQKGKNFLIKSGQGRPGSNKSKGSSKKSSVLGISELNGTPGREVGEVKAKNEMKSKDIRHMKYARHILPTIKQTEKKMKLAKSKVSLDL